jgi:protein tyrosine/serine phosphatase
MRAPAPTGLNDWAELMLKDHGVLRLAWHNLHEIDDNMWRSNQPTPKRVEQAADLGVKTIINLRGPRNDGGWRLEAEACKKVGITLVDFTARSRAAPDKKMLYAARDLFNSVEMPALMHCKSGADRAGLMAALYLLIRHGRPVAEALQQLSFRYLHVRQAKTGLLDCFLEAYAPYEAKGMPFFDWVDKIYEPEKLQAEFMSRPWAEKLIDGILRRE